MKWKGKLIGLLLGVLTRNRMLVLVGLAIGQLYDMGFFDRKPAEPTPPIADADPFAVLGVSASASEAEIEQAYRRRMSEYHPDRVANAAQEIRDLAGVRAREVNAAYETIKRQRSR